MNDAVQNPRDRRPFYHYASLAILLVSIATGVFYAISLQRERNAAVERTREAFAELQARRDPMEADDFKMAIARQQRQRVPLSDEDFQRYRDFLVAELPVTNHPSLMHEYFETLALLGDSSCCGEMQKAMDRLREPLREGGIVQSHGPNGSLLEFCEAAMRALGCPERDLVDETVNQSDVASVNLTMKKIARREADAPLP
jgi:hypothetical protein